MSIGIRILRICRIKSINIRIGISISISISINMSKNTRIHLSMSNNCVSGRHQGVEMGIDQVDVFKQGRFSQGCKIMCGVSHSVDIIISISILISIGMLIRKGISISMSMNININIDINISRACV